jgi:hypothetical protein
MYSLALIIFVVSEKKAFEHFPIGSNVNLCPAMAAILDFRCVPDEGYSRNTSCTLNLISTFLLYMSTCLLVHFVSSPGPKVQVNYFHHLASVVYPTGTKNSNFVENHPRKIPAKFGSNRPSGFGEEA